MEIRVPEPADAEAVGLLHLACWREAYSELLPEAFWGEDAEQRWIRRWRENLAAPSEGVVRRIAVRDGEAVGLAAAGPSRPNATAGDPVRDRELWALYVRRSEYGTGLAARLLDAVLVPGPAELWVFEENRRARAFYGRHGFAPDGARNVFGPELGEQPEIRMVR